MLEEEEPEGSAYGNDSGCYYRYRRDRLRRWRRKRQVGEEVGR